MILGDPTALSETIPAPVFGWTTRQDLHGMDPRFAITMDNWFPGEQSITLRAGQSAYVSSGMGSDSVDSLIEHVTEAGVRSFLAATDGKIYNVTTSTPSSITTGFSSDRWQSVMMNKVTVLVNGVDQPQQWDGTTLSAAAYTGVTDELLITGTNFKQKLYFVEKDSTSIWWRDQVAAITGALTEFDPAPFYLRGGYTMCVGTWNDKAGDLRSQLFVCMSSEGDVLVYSGLDPSESDWTLAARLKLAKPLGRRAFIQRADDIEILTRSGKVSLKAILESEGDEVPETSESAEISSAWLAAAKNYGTSFGWEGAVYIDGKAVVHNIPIVSGSQSHQYVQNLYTKAWTRFTGWNAACFGVFNDQLYYGTFDGKIKKAFNGLSDSSSNIATDLRLAYNYLGDRKRSKTFLYARPVLRASNSVTFGLGIDVDFQFNDVLDTVTTQGVAGSAWDTFDWDTTPWGSDYVYSNDWYSIPGDGRCGSLHMKGSFKDVDLLMAAVQIQYRAGGLM